MPQETQCRVGLAAQRGAVQCFLASAGMMPEVASFGDHLQQRNRRSVIVREQTVGNAQILGQEAMEQPGPAEDACQAAAAQIGFGIILAFQSPECSGDIAKLTESDAGSHGMFQCVGRQHQECAFRG